MFTGEPSYAVIQGKWLSEQPYVVLHRLAVSGEARGGGVGIIISILSAAVCSLYAITCKRVSIGVKARTMLLYQMVGGLIGVSILIPVYLMFFPSSQPVCVVPDGANLWWLLGLALFCTAGLYLLQIIVLRTLSAFTVNLTYNLEPCYAILIAFLAFGEARELNASFYVGISMVILSVVLQTLRSVRKKKEKILE